MAKVDPTEVIWSFLGVRRSYSHVLKNVGFWGSRLGFYSTSFRGPDVSWLGGANRAQESDLSGEGCRGTSEFTDLGFRCLEVVAFRVLRV